MNFIKKMLIGKKTFEEIYMEGWNDSLEYSLLYIDLYNKYGDEQARKLATPENFMKYSLKAKKKNNK